MTKYWLVKTTGPIIVFLEEKKEASFDTLMEGGYGRAVINHLSETDFVEVFYREKETVYLPTAAEKMKMDLNGRAGSRRTGCGNRCDKPDLGHARRYG